MTRANLFAPRNFKQRPVLREFFPPCPWAVKPTRRTATLRLPLLGYILALRVGKRFLDAVSREGYDPPGGILRRPDPHPAYAFDWTEQRKPPRAIDLVLSGVAKSSCTALPEWLRPHQLCRLYPRIANRIALCWPEQALTELLFSDLLIDKRGDRKGFPSEVAVELVRLRHFNLRRAAEHETAYDRWARHMQAPVDR